MPEIPAGAVLSIISAVGLLAVAAAKSEPEPPNDLTLDLGPDRNHQIDDAGNPLLLLSYTSNASGQKLWETVSGPTTAHVVNTGPFSASVHFPVSGNYVIKLTITTQEGQQVSDLLGVTVTLIPPPPPPPVLELGPGVDTQLGADGTITITLDYTLEPVGNKVWLVESGPGSVIITDTGPSIATLKFTVAGNYVIRLTVDYPSPVQPVTDTIPVSISPAPPPPPPLTLELGAPISIGPDATGHVHLILDYTSNAPDNISKVWTVLSGPAVDAVVTITDTGPRQAHMEFSMPGDYVVQLAITVTGSGDTVSDTKSINVQGPQPPCPPPPPGVTVITGAAPFGFTVPAGQTWEVRGLVDAKASVIVRGILRMRGGCNAHLQFSDINESNFQGGGFNPATDIGLWVVDAGQLDCQGTPKAAWDYGITNHITWKATDELRECPLFNSEIGITSGFRSYTAGAALRTMPDGRKLPVLNLTRDCKISGTAGRRAHIRITSSSPQLIRYTEISYMAPPKFEASGKNVGIAGRYGLHFHQCVDGSRNSLIEGVVIKRCGFWGYVPHESHGIIFRDCISYDTENHGFTWDEKTVSRDIVYDHCVAAFVHQAVQGYRIAGFGLESGFGNIVRDCLAVGVQHDGSNQETSGYTWPEGATQPVGGVDPGGVWVFDNNTSLANRGWGIFTWQNDGKPHHVPTAGKFVSIYCTAGGVNHGAYRNRYQYRDLEIYNVPGGIGTEHHAASNASNINSTQSWRSVKIRGGRYGIHFSESQQGPLFAGVPVLLLNYDIQGQSGKKVRLSNFVVRTPPVQASFYDIVTTDPALIASGVGIRDTDVEVSSSAVPGSIIRIQRGSQAWRVTHTGAVTVIPPFYPYPQ